MGDEKAAERIDLLARFAGHELVADHGADVLEVGARIGDKGIVGLPHDRGRLVAVVLVVDFADDLLDDVLDRHQAVGAAIFVDHERQMDARRLHLRQQVDRRHRRRHVEQLAGDVGFAQRQRQIDGAQVETGRRRFFAFRLGRQLGARPHSHEREQVADMNDAFGIVEVFVVDDETGMRRALEHVDQLAERNIALDRDDVGAMDHDIGDAPFVQTEDVAQHGALDGGKAGLVGRRGVEHHLKIGADRSRFPSEQRADRPHQPALRDRTQHFAVVHRHRQVAVVLRRLAVAGFVL